MIARLIDASTRAGGGKLNRRQCEKRTGLPLVQVVQSLHQPLIVA
jgi:hypothetical protein